MCLAFVLHVLLELNPLLVLFLPAICGDLSPVVDTYLEPILESFEMRTGYVSFTDTTDLQVTIVLLDVISARIDGVNDDDIGD